MTGKLFKTCAIALAILGIWHSTGETQGAITYRTVALKGEQMPGMPSGASFNHFLYKPTITASGQIMVEGQVEISEDAGVPITRNGAWLIDTDGSLYPIVLVGDPEPEAAPGLGITYFDPAIFSRNGLMVALSFIYESNGLDLWGLGILSGGSSTSRYVAKTGDQAPGLNLGVEFSGFEMFPTNNDAGQALFTANLRGPGVDHTNRTSVWSEGGGTLHMIAREGDDVPNMPEGVTFDQLDISFWKSDINASGQTAFTTSMHGPGIDDTNNLGLWSEDSGTLSLLVQSGDQAPGMEPGASFKGMGYPVQINDSGQVLFGAALSGDGYDFSNNWGLWLSETGTLSPIVHKGDTAPGTDSGTMFESVSNYPVLSENGQVWLYGSLLGPGVDATNDEGIWGGDEASLDLLVRKGDAAPGMGSGVFFDDLTPQVIPNGAGQVVFSANVTGTGIDESNNLSVWLSDPSGSLTPILREGDPFDVNSDPLIDDYRTIRSIIYHVISHAGDHQNGAFNDVGEFVFRLTFTDDSEGIFVATIPEPGTLGVLVVGAGVMVRRRCG